MVTQGCMLSMTYALKQKNDNCNEFYFKGFVIWRGKASYH